MPETQLSGQAAATALPSLRIELPNLRHVLACVDGPPFAEAVLTHAAAVAKAVGARLTVMHVLESSTTLSAQEPMDPVEWSLRHCDTHEYLGECVLRLDGVSAETVIVAGLPAERISAWAQDNGADLVVLGRGGEKGQALARLGDTARRVAELAKASVLLVPAMHNGDTQMRYRKLLVPLDGSSRSECVLPLGLGIAAAHGADVVLVHVAHHVELMESNLLNAQAVALRDQLHRHNEGAARQYLDWLRCRLPAPPQTCTRLLPCGDARRALLNTVIAEQADLMVLAAAGKSGHADITLGSVADYLINRLVIPVLLVRQPQSHLPPQPNSYSEALSSQSLDIRMPGMKEQGIL